MTITLNTEYDVALSTALLGYVGETNARPVSVEGLTVDGADRYVMTIDYGDGTAYEVDITGGQWTPTADILRSAQTVSCQICAKKLSGQEYILLKKSRIFRLRIGAAIGDVAVPPHQVTVDALDRIDAIGRQTHADMQTAVTAAETATTAAENAEKSATTAGVSADTATQAAERAETAKTAAETSAAQAETAMQGAETARAEAVTSQNNAKISAAQASTSAQQTEADKIITAGYAKTAKTCADSLPEDYTTAVGKIAENTAEIGRVKMSDKELKRRVDALFDIGQGVTHKFETDTDTAYAKTVPTGAKLMSVKSVGGRSIVWNQLVQPTSNEITGAGVKVTFSDDGIITLNGTATTTGNAVSVQPVKNQKEHKYLIVANPLSGVYGAGQLLFSSQSYGLDSTGHGAIITNGSSNEKWYYTLYVYKDVTYDNVKLQPQIFDLTQMFGSGNEPSTVEEFESMFPNGYYPYNEGELMSMSVNNVVEQGKNLFDCYGFSCIAILNVNGERKLNNSYGTTISTIEPTNKIVVTQSQAPESVIAHSNNGWFCVGIKGMEQSKRYTFSFDFTTTKMLIQNPVLQILVNGRFPEDAINISELNVKKRVSFTLEYTKVDDRQYIELRLSGMSGIFENFQLDEGSTATAYTPYYTPISYTIPQAIQNLDGYGWSAGTARNYVDYENKRYVQCVGAVDLGSLTWKNSKAVSFETRELNGQKLTKSYGIAPNFICSKYLTKTQDNLWNKPNVTGITADANTDGYIYVNDASYTDATEFKQAMSGVILYYELESPIVTDISTLIDFDFLRNIEVEAGGSITFKNSNDSYRIPVPSEEEYIVKLSEVGGTT